MFFVNDPIMVVNTGDLSGKTLMKTKNGKEFKGAILHIYDHRRFLVFSKFTHLQFPHFFSLSDDQN